MLKILTATGNAKFNNNLKNYNEFEVYENDIQYKEAIIDVIEKNKNFDFLIVYNKLPGEITFDELKNKIKKINNKIKIIFIYENKKINIEEIILKIKNNKLNIKKINNYKINIFYGNNKINKKIIINNLLKINNKKILIIEFNNENKLIKNKNNLINYIKKINKNINLFNFNLFIKLNKSNNIEKTINNLFLQLLNKYDLIIINLNYKNIYEKYFIKNCEKIIFNLELNINEIKNINNLINYLLLKFSINKNKINILINNKNKLVNLKIIKNIFKKYKIIKKLIY